MIPLIPIITGVVSSVVGGLTAWRIRKKKLKIAVIGPEEGGKTAFIKLLEYGQVKDASYKQTGLNESLLEIEAFWTKENKLLRTDIAINSDAGLWEKIKDFIPGDQYGGKDIPGEIRLLPDYKKILEGKLYSFFFFNIKRYFDENEYKKDVNCRLDFLNDYLHCKNLIVVATHIDEINEDVNKIASTFKDMVKDKPYIDVLKNVKYINLLDEKAGEEMRKCFGKDGE